MVKLIKSFKSNPPPINMAIFFVSVIGFHILIWKIGYSFIPISGYAFCIISIFITIGFTVMGFILKTKKTKAAVIAFLPLLAIVFLIAVSDTSSTSSAKDIQLYIVYVYTTYICSVVAFLSSGHRKVIKLLLGIIYVILVIPISFLFFFIVFISILSEDIIVKSEMSPNSLYLAEILVSYKGRGGFMLVNATRQNQNKNILIGEFRVRPKNIYRDELDEPETMTLRWESDNILYINEKKYLIK